MSHPVVVVFRVPRTLLWINLLIIILLSFSVTSFQSSFVSGAISSPHTRYSTISNLSILKNSRVPSSRRAVSLTSDTSKNKNNAADHLSNQLSTNLCSSTTEGIIKAPRGGSSGETNTPIDISTETSTNSTQEATATDTNMSAKADAVEAPTGGLGDGAKLLIGAGGIYAAFLYYGSLQEDVFRYVASDGTSFKQAWLLQVLEALANVVIGFIGMQITGPTKGIPLKMFAISGASQVSAKACTSLALANGLSFPIATLAKSGKMAPVMAGQLLLGGASYTLREYLQVAMIIGGTAVVSMGKKKGPGGASSMVGVAYIIGSLVLDGVTAGFQKRLKTETAKVGVKPKPYDFMFWTNLFMCGTALCIALLSGEMTSGLAYCFANNEIFEKIIKFAICSAVGQSFIFYTIANFDPLILSTVTTTRKIFSVLLSIFLKGHSLSLVGWSGIGLSVSGILSELQSKASAKKGGKGSHAH